MYAISIDQTYIDALGSKAFDAFCMSVEGQVLLPQYRYDGTLEIELFKPVVLDRLFTSSIAHSVHRMGGDVEICTKFRYFADPSCETGSVCRHESADAMRVVLRTGKPGVDKKVFIPHVLYTAYNIPIKFKIPLIEGN